jgi:hypothetical protein
MYEDKKVAGIKIVNHQIEMCTDKNGAFTALHIRYH